MASIVKRGRKYSVVYYYKDIDGTRKQKQETCENYSQAKIRKSQIEYKQNIGNFLRPNATTIKELLEDYVSIYGTQAWSLSTYQSKKGLINNYINPIIGDIKLRDITPRMIDILYKIYHPWYFTASDIRASLIS